MVKKIQNMELADRQQKVRRLADMVGISKSALQCILNENLDIKNLCSIWVLCLFTVEQIQGCEDVSIEYLAMFHINKPDFLRRFITMNET